MAKKRSTAGDRRPPAVDWVHQFLIVLPGTDPLVWRRIQVPESYSFWDLHVAIQDAMGWLDCHLHEFRVVIDSRTGRLARFGIPGDDSFGQPKVQPDWTVKVSDILSPGALPILYVYDFGDDWSHTLRYEGGVQRDGSATYPRCVSGERRCPPEDCGGVHGYAEFLDAMRDPQHARHAEFLEWIGEPFDLGDFDARMIAFSDPKKRWKTAFEDSQE